MVALEVVMAIVALTAGLLCISILFRCKKSHRVCIIVLGDIGRSPRMMYHSISLASAGFQVDIVGFDGSPCIKEVMESPKIGIIPLALPISKFSGVPPFVHYVIKTVHQSLQLAVVLLFKVSKPNIFFIQNPPSIPSLAIAWFVCLIKGSKIIIDWHNYGYTILSLNLKRKDNPLVKCAYWYEGFFGRRAHQNICVTKAMQQDLRDRWGIRLMFDAVHFRFLEKCAAIEKLKKKNTLFRKLGKEYPEFLGNSMVENETAFTHATEDGLVSYKKERPAFVVSSTSWTDDEDFSVLLDALTIYEEVAKENKGLYPDIVCCITGKGPLKEYYLTLIKKKNFVHVAVITPWLTHDDYPKLIGSADFGICLHFSSSGLDLPMKVVDMFGCCLPVCAISYSCLHELVKHGENGLHFKTSAELAKHIMDLLDGFPSNQKTLEKFKENLEPFVETRWNDSWQRTVSSLFTSA